ncbi:rhodanese-like domain-containing protein [Aureibacter tunicatorum]|uniref:Rhodanese-related sulfurtransferase n=1 Tax=Aureibacter tunicatorum TaxID=866807 RepID=A0AAE3XSB3_9BACT|nr:rhodanese-like domain-containing protein [Aureibacter tunicatorum]MDR6240991.1 rhodanese-related sulfurtransferase [Aureibacter tunicatorum]BDD03770.1 thioredoxin [Aureibacter tunicatorum]
MKKILLILLAIINLTASCQEKKHKDIDVKQLNEILASNKVQLLDVRTPQELKRGKIEYAVNINVKDNDFISQAENTIDKNEPVYIYCHSGGRSATAARKLTQAGYENVINVDGGITDWIANGYAVNLEEDNSSINMDKVNLFIKKLDNKPMTVVNFYATWCGSCKKNRPILDKLSTDFTQFEYIHLDVDKHPDIFKYYKLQAVPSLLIFKGSKMESQNDGLIKEGELRNKLNSIASSL